MRRVEYITPDNVNSSNIVDVHPSQSRVIDWEVEEAEERRPAPAPRPTYVPPARDVIMPRVNMADPNTHVGADITPAAVIEGRTVGSHRDRAGAWLKYSVPLCIAIAASMTIASWALYDVPVLSFSTLLTFGLAFVISYTVLLLRYWQHTPEGVALTHTRYLWGYLRREQAHRHRIEQQAWEDQRQITREDRR